MAISTLLSAVYKQNPFIHCQQEIHFRLKDTHTKKEKIEKVTPCKEKQSWDSNTRIKQNILKNI